MCSLQVDYPWPSLGVFRGGSELPHCDTTPTFVIYEQLRLEQQVANILGLTQEEIEDNFSGNAVRFIEEMRSERSS